MQEKLFLKDVDVAERLNISVALVRKLRLTGGGPKFVKIGRVVRYPVAMLSEYASNLVFRNRTSEKDEREK